MQSENADTIDQDIFPQLTVQRSQ